MFTPWMGRYGGWICLVVMASLCCVRSVAYGGWILLGVLAFLTSLVSGFGHWRAKFPAGTGVTVAVFALVFLANAVFSSNPYRTVTAWPFFFWLLASLPVGLAFADTQPVRRWWLHALMTGTGVGCLLLLLDIWRNPHDMRPDGDLGIMGYAGVLGLTMPVLLAHLLELLCRPPEKAAGGSNRRLAWALLLAMDACAACILLNATRIIVISAVVTTLFLAASYGRRLSGRAVLALLTLPVIAVAVFVGRPWFSSQMAALAHSLPVLATLDEPAEIAQAETAPAPTASSDHVDPSIMARWDMWGQALRAFAEHPLLGHGFRTIANPPPPASASGPRQVDGGRRNFHNTYLQFAAETGILGLFALLGLFMPGLWLALKRFGNPDPEIRMWSRIAIALLLDLAIHALTDSLLGIRIVPYLYGMLAALTWTRMMDVSPPPPTETERGRGMMIFRLCPASRGERV